MEGVFYLMLEAAKNILQRIASLNEKKLISTALQDQALQDEIIRMNTQDQLYEKGIDAQGKEIGQYRPATIQGTKNFQGKIQKGQRYDHITLNDTGKFYNSFKIKRIGSDFIITADVLKGAKYVITRFNEDKQTPVGNKEADTNLQQEYGKDILGLTSENTNYVANEVKKSVLSQIREKLFT